MEMESKCTIYTTEKEKLAKAYLIGNCFSWDIMIFTFTGGR